MRLISLFVVTMLLCACGGGTTKSPSSSVPRASSLMPLPSSASLAASSQPLSSAAQSSTAVAVNQMVPFVLPFDDGSAGITHVGAALNHTPAGKFGALKTNSAGHFILGDQRERFLGVNITASSALTSKENAEKVARRLAKFGVNLVRFHHIDNHFGAKSIINYGAGNSRSLDAENLDKLDYFIYQLKLNGIYTNLNLINSREFSAADGLPADIAQLSWKQAHVLGFVNSDFRDLEKEYARLLLSHKNPYTGLSYAQDPAVAFVEINNENGIFQQYFDGALDHWPAVFADQLKARWNQWLAAKYASNTAMEAAWGALDQPLGAEKLQNADFAAGLSQWNLEQHETARVNATAGDFAGRAGIELKVTQAGAADWHVQLNQAGLSVVAGQLYTLGFWARADQALNLGVALGLAYDPWSTLETRSYAVSGSWQYFETRFLASATDTNTRINFNGFGSHLATVYLADVSFKAGGSIGHLPAGQSLESMNVANNLRAEGYTAERERDWADFLRALESAYWADMKGYIKTDLAFSGLVTGTAIMNSPPSAQAQMDYADAHAYWQHPVFPGADWDAVNWTVSNVSMVNSLSNTLTALAKQRINGLPFTISEYQHATPNSYGSEGPLLVAAYGALQDWDGIMMFAYDAGPDDNWGLGYFSDFFSMNAHPTKMANMLIAANIFRRGDIAAAQTQLLMNFDPATELDILATKGSSWNVASGTHQNVPNEIPLTQRFALAVSDNPQGQNQAPAATALDTLVADTQQLRWDLSVAEKGLVTVNSDKTKALVGFIDGRVQTLGNLRIAVAATERNWATVSLTAQTGSFATPEAPASILIVATGNAENTAMQWTSPAHNSLSTHWGTGPTLVEVIPFTIDLPFAAGRTRAWVLDETGQRRAELPVQDQAGKARLSLDGTSASLWYEVEVL